MPRPSRDLPTKYFGRPSRFPGNIFAQRAFCRSPGIFVHSHDIDLCVAGAAKARGKYLIFTEAHVGLNRTCLSTVLRPSMPILIGPDSHAYRPPITPQSLIEAKHICTWRTSNTPCIASLAENHDNCFVTNAMPTNIAAASNPESDILPSGPCRQRFSARLQARILPKARFYHYYSGSLRDLKTFTLDFVTGEAAI